MRTDELDFVLPPELIAQTPPQRREASRLLHYRRHDRSITHRTFSDLPGLLSPNDLLVFNDARVIPARFMLRKHTGGKIEGLFLSEPTPGQWQVMLRNAGQPAAGTRYVFDERPEIEVEMLRKGPGGEYTLAVPNVGPAAAFLDQIGRMPLPPYIRREKSHDDRDDADRDRYQTVYAKTPGAVAAPTAGLHFTNELLTEIDARGIERVTVTLHVGAGTFKPVDVETLDQHPMHSENYEVGEESARKLNAAIAAGRRVIAVGTTSARVLESWPAGEPFRAATGSTSIFIYPPYRWKRVGALLTNFHLPRSTLVALVAAFVGLDEQRKIYQDAIANRYRFFSYGDAMLLE